MTTERATGEMPVARTPAEHLREEMYRMLDEIAKGGERAANARKRFEALWNELPQADPTVH